MGLLSAGKSLRVNVTTGRKDDEESLGEFDLAASKSSCSFSACGLTMDIAADPLPTGVAGIPQRLALGARVHESVFVAPGATVVGDVTLSEGSSVWYNAVLRGDINRIVIGARSNLQDCAVVHLANEFPAIVGELVTVGHSAVVHACVIDDEVLVGMGAVILDGAEIGARSIIGANALVTGGTKVPPGSLLLGSPARVVRRLALEEQAKIKTWALKYVENVKYFRQHYAELRGD